LKSPLRTAFCLVSDLTPEERTFDSLCAPGEQRHDSLPLQSPLGPKRHAGVHTDAFA